MPEAPMRAIVWSTGWIGSIAIRAVNRRPDFALIGVWIHSPEKVGHRTPVHWPVWNQSASPPPTISRPCLPSHPIASSTRPAVPTATAAVPDYVRILEAGIYIVTVTSPALVFPPGFDPTWTEELT